MAAFFCLEQSALAAKAERAEPIGKLNRVAVDVPNRARRINFLRCERHDHYRNQADAETEQVAWHFRSDTP